MPRRSILSAAERESLLALPDTKDELIRHYTFSESDLSIIRQRRGPANRLGFAVQLCYLRFPGVILGADEPPFPPLLRLVANQLKVGIESWDEYGQREQTRREHLVELQTVFGFQPFTIGHYRQAVQLLTELAMQTDKGIVLARALIEHLRRQSVIVPALNAVERASAEAITRANRRLYDALAEPLTDVHRRRLDELRAAPAAKDVLDAIEVLRGMNSDNARKVPADAPTEFIKPRWQKLVMTDTGIDRRYYELCALSEMKNALRSGDIWVQGSRQFKDFEDYLVPPAKFASLKQASELPLAVATDCNRYLNDRLTLLETQLATVNRMATANELPDAIITESGLKITPLDAAVPDTAQALIDQTAMILPHVKITELLLEVDEWTGFTRHFAHLKSGDPAKDKNLLLTTILADAINLGLTKMAESCPGTTYAKLAWLQAWHIRDETYGAALADLVNAQFRHPFAEHWGDGTTSSSDGQNFRTGSKAESTGHINPKYGSSPGRTFYTHISDQYAPFHTKVVNVGVRDSTYVLDGLLYHESDLRIEEHYTDTAGFTDHVFALMHLLGFRFAPRIRDLGDTKLYIPKGDAAYDALKPMIGGTLNIKHVRAHWDEILRLATSIKQGTVTASLMLRKLGSYPRQNGLAVALRELGRIERTLFILDWLQSVELRRRVHAGLNKGEARNALARAVFFNRLGEIRDRSFEQQRYRASGLNLVTAAVVLWNTVYLERAAHALRGNGHAVDDALLQYLSPLGWEHINLTGDYLWRSSAKIGAGKFRPLRPLQPA
ncbi:Tn3 family transposase [Klebsiella pneumoniae]|uniref:Tn3 family transposase n=1 Tax=Klebsiella pneumoniae TaxID=573 RepID=UPI00227ADFE4|nr:Tn3 family transposase [Klebsiella pneumoniae]MCY3474525.1 Tn3 family transposase [Klebsiella pneumoniae]